MFGRRHIYCNAFVALAAVLTPAQAVEVANAPPDPSVRLAKIAPVQPSKAEATFRLAPGFEIQQVAAEPLTHDPIAIEWDENGYAYVIELAPYNAPPDKKPTGTIRRLEDADNDGKFDHSTVFADNLAYPTGLFCWNSGLIVGNSPELLYLGDNDGDGRADERKVLFTGIGVEPSGEGRLNSFRWGLDNRIHISTSHAGGEVRPGDQPDAKPLSIRNRHILLDPRTWQIELTSGAGQHGLALDDWGRTYACENSDPFIMLMYDDRYLTRNPLMAAPSAAVSIAQDGKYTNLMRLSPVDPWRVIRTKLRAEGKFAGPLEEGRVSGFFTAATGVCVYRGNAWPEEYRGNLLIGEAANNLVYRARLEHKGLKTISNRADVKAEFLASTDTWFRPVQLANAPDGALYVVDMYRELIETVLALPPEVLTQLNPLEGADRGRIYRIVPAIYKQPARPKLGELPTAELVSLLEHSNGWHRDTASRLLYERQDKSAVATLRELAESSALPQGRLHALWALAGLESLNVEDVLRALADDHPRVREHASRLAERFASSSKRIQRELVNVVADPDAWVRFQLAFSLGEAPRDDRLPALVELLRRDGDSSWIRMAIQSSLGTGAPDFIRRVLADRELRESKHGQTMLAALADQVGRGRKNGEIGAVVKALDELAGEPDAVKSLTKSLAISLFANGRGATAEELIGASGGRVKDVVDTLLGDARQTALDPKQSPAVRAEATRLLACDSFSAVSGAIEELLDARQPQPVQEAALGALARFSDPAAATLVLNKWRALTPRPRAIAVEMLCSRPDGTAQLLAAIERGDIASADIDPGRVALLKSHADPATRERAAALFGEPTGSNREELIAKYRPALALTGDIERGRAAFRKTCSACHQLEGVGTVIGADLKAIADRGAESVLLNVLDPNREIKPQFLNYVVYTDDGRSIAGIITEETANNLTLRRPDGTPVTLSRGEIEEVRSTGLSYMPEGLEQQVNVQTMADLLAYLAAVK